MFSSLLYLFLSYVKSQKIYKESFVLRLGRVLVLLSNNSIRSFCFNIMVSILSISLSDLMFYILFCYI